MVVAACGMKKRSTRSIGVESKLRFGLDSNIDEEFQQLIDDIVKEEELHSETLNAKQLGGNMGIPRGGQDGALPPRILNLFSQALKYIKKLSIQCIK